VRSGLTHVGAIELTVIGASRQRAHAGAVYLVANATSLAGVDADITIRPDAAFERLIRQARRDPIHGPDSEDSHMKSRHVIVFVCLVTMGISTARAQQAYQVLRFEITKGDVLVASPQLLLQSGMLGRIHLDSRDARNVALISGLRERIALTPTVQGDNISITFDIMSDDKQFRPSLVISKDVKGAFEWVSTEGQRIRISVSWLPIK
jgi:hypothetical protein